MPALAGISMHTPHRASGVLAPRARISLRFRAWSAILLFSFSCFVAGTMALTLLFRWVPVPFSSLMVQRQLGSQWQQDGGREFELRYQWVGMAEISPYAPLAVLAAEDQKFLVHHGFDFEAISRAWEHNKRHQRQRGASTISQQVAKNLFLWPGRNLFRKGLEAYFTIILEWFWPKQRILEAYLNIAEFGPGLFGIEAASRTYFHKPASRLSQTEAALLAAILPSPLKSSPVRPSEYIRKRARHIEKQMRQLGGLGFVKPLTGKAGEG